MPDSDVPMLSVRRPPVVAWAGAALILVGIAMMANGIVAMAGEGAVYPAALIVVGIGGVAVATGAGVLAGRTWARVLGLLFGTAVGLLTLAGTPGREDPVIIAVSLVVVATNAFVVWVLATKGRWFALLAARK